MSQGGKDEELNKLSKVHLFIQCAGNKLEKCASCMYFDNSLLLIVILERKSKTKQNKTNNDKKSGASSPRNPNDSIFEALQTVVLLSFSENAQI